MNIEDKSKYFEYKGILSRSKLFKIFDKLGGKKNIIKVIMHAYKISDIKYEYVRRGYLGTIPNSNIDVYIDEDIPINKILIYYI